MNILLFNGDAATRRRMKRRLEHEGWKVADLGDGDPAARRYDPLAAVDPLTGLPSGVDLEAKVDRALARLRRKHEPAALIKVNIDNCREINTAYGRRLGDEVIRFVGACLAEQSEKWELLVRDSGDEFTLLLARGVTRATAGATCERLIRGIQLGAQARGLGVRLTLSLGMALYPEDAANGTALVERAAHALEEAKNAGRDCWRDFPTAALANPWVGGQHLFRPLVEALQAKALHTEYQPITDARTGAVTGFEALARWKDPQLGPVPPNHFIPVAETRGLIVELGRLVADQSIRQLAAWRQRGYAVGLSLNLAKRQILEATFCQELRELVRQHGVDPGWVTLEATERQSLMDDPVCRQCLERLVAEGFRLALDDFGAGHSTFDMVDGLPFHEIKIDRAMVTNARTERGRCVLKAIVGMCRDLKLISVAEGIEDRRLAKLTRDLGATRLQGYYFARPMRAEETWDYLAIRGRKR